MSRVGEGTIPDRLWLATFGTLAIVTGSLCVAFALRSGRDPRWVARRIEEKHPDLDTGLLAALEIDSADGQLGFLQSAVIRHALAHGQAHHWDDTVPTWRVRGAQLAHVVALGALVFVGFSLLDRTRSRSAALAEIVLADDGSEIEVDPGDTELERGSPLLVVARFKGAVPPDAKLVVEDKARVVAPKVMTRSLEDPTFAVALIPSRQTSPTISTTRDGAASRTRSPSSNIPNCNGLMPSSFFRLTPHSNRRQSKTSATSPRLKGPS